MIVRITRILLFLQLIVAAAVAAAIDERLHLANPAIAIILGIGTVLLLRMLITANNFFLSWRYRSQTPEAYRLNWRQACKLFLGEFRATMMSSSVAMPFYSFTKRIAQTPSALPVLLIHGYGCNSGYWHAMSKALLQADITHYAIDMEPITGSIDDYVPIVQRSVLSLCKETGSEKIIIIAHSMGGLVARAYLREHGLGRIAKVITLGTPHHGTGVARYGVGLNCRQMHWNAEEKKGASSEWIRQLQESEDKETYRHVVSIYSHHDNIVSPQISSHLSGATNIEFYGIGHVALALHPKVQARVIAEIREASQNMTSVDTIVP